MPDDVYFTATGVALGWDFARWKQSIEDTFNRTTPGALQQFISFEWQNQIRQLMQQAANELEAAERRVADAYVEASGDQYFNTNETLKAEIAELREQIAATEAATIAERKEWQNRHIKDARDRDAARDELKTLKERQKATDELLAQLRRAMPSERCEVRDFAGDRCALPSGHADGHEDEDGCWDVYDEW